MNDRAQAIAILQKARDILAQRMTELILEAREEILDDAQGNSYAGEIDGLHDQIGLRLSHVNTMLANLPTVEDPPAGSKVDRPSSPSVESSTIDTGIPSAGAVGYLAASNHSQKLAPQAEPPVMPISEPVSFQLFVQQMMSHQVDAAGHSLVALLDVSAERGRECAATFHDRLANQPDFLAKAMRLRGELQTGSVNGALSLLYECFGLTGIEAIGVMQTLKARLR
jgi:hypothetical protein